jgi:hypothetical protein
MEGNGIWAKKPFSFQKGFKEYGATEFYSDECRDCAVPSVPIVIGRDLNYAITDRIKKFGQKKAPQ